MKGEKKRARMGVDKTPEGVTPKKRKAVKPTTRARTLKDMLNTLNNKSPSASKSSEEFVSGPLASPLPEKFPTSCSSPMKITPKSQEVPTGPYVEAKATSTESATGPSRRWGHTLCMINEGEAVMIGGQGEKQQFCKDSMWHLDLVRGTWRTPDTTHTGPKPEARMGHTAVYDPTVRCIYIFGGSKNLKWFNDVHVLELDDWKWQLIKTNGKAPTRVYHSCTLYRHELWIYGGVYPRPDPQPDGCSGDVHVFSPIEEGWYDPIVMGDKPAPRSGHSATLLQDQLVVFGGWDAPVPFNDLHVLDLVLLEWTQPKVNGTPPSPRSWHASTALSGNRILIHGGYNGNDALEDAFIFNLDVLSWTHVLFDSPIVARAGHTSLCLPYRHENTEKDEVLIFGGGNNEGSFFADLVGVMVPWADSSTCS